MVKQTRIDFHLEGLNELISELDSGLVTRVGILGAKNTRDEGDDMGNADVGLVMEVGSDSQGIPARSFLRMPLETQGVELIKGMQSGSAKDAFNRGNIRGVFKIMGVLAEKIVDDAFASGGFGHWPALKKETIARKGSSAILINTSQLRRGVTSDVVGKEEI